MSWYRLPQTCSIVLRGLQTIRAVYKAVMVLHIAVGERGLLSTAIVYSGRVLLQETLMVPRCLPLIYREVSLVGYM